MNVYDPTRERLSDAHRSPDRAAGSDGSGGEQRAGRGNSGMGTVTAPAARSPLTSGVVAIEQLRAEVLGPIIARLIRDDYEHGTREFPHYSASVGGTFGLDASQTWCPLCGSGFDPTRPQFAYVCDKTSALWQRDPRVGRALVVLHGACVRLAQSTGLALDDWFAQMAADEKAVALNERGD